VTAAQALQQLRTRVEYLIEHARTNHPLGPQGIAAGYTPAAFGEGYTALYLRDFAYMAESAPEFVPLAHVQAILELFVARQSTEGLTPERITSGGEAIYVCHGAKPAADSAMFLVKLAAAYAGNGGDARLVAAMYPKLCRTLSTVPRDVQTGLV
jgi:hypothetical protein